MATPILISFIGSGNLAWHLAPALDNMGYVVREVYSQNHKHAEALTERLYQADVKVSLDFSTSDSQVFIIAVSDDAISDVAREIIIPEDALLVHTSGSQPITELQFAATQNLGVLYPLQTFSKSKKIDFKEVPVFIEGTTETAEATLTQIAMSISKQVRKISSEERRALHIAAVFASNFSNHMLTIAKELMQQNNLNYEWLKPLISETINKSMYLGPDHAQTGPAKRGDLDILESHLEFLKEQEPIAEIYRVISQHIIDTHYEG